MRLGLPAMHGATGCSACHGEQATSDLARLLETGREHSFGCERCGDRPPTTERPGLGRRSRDDAVVRCRVCGLLCPKHVRVRCVDGGHHRMTWQREAPLALPIVPACSACGCNEPRDPTLHCLVCGYLCAVHTKLPCLLGDDGPHGTGWLR